MELAENREICHCKKVSLLDIENVLHESENFSQVEKAFEEVQRVTHCSTGCGGCHDEIMRVISGMMSA